MSCCSATSPSSAVVTTRPPCVSSSRLHRRCDARGAVSGAALSAPSCAVHCSACKAHQVELVVVDQQHAQAAAGSSSSLRSRLRCCRRVAAASHRGRRRRRLGRASEARACSSRHWAWCGQHARLDSCGVSAGAAGAQLLLRRLVRRCSRSRAHQPHGNYHREARAAPRRTLQADSAAHRCAPSVVPMRQLQHITCTQRRLCCCTAPSTKRLQMCSPSGTRTQ